MTFILRLRATSIVRLLQIVGILAILGVAYLTLNTTLRGPGIGRIILDASLAVWFYMFLDPIRALRTVADWIATSFFGAFAAYICWKTLLIAGTLNTNELLTLDTAVALLTILTIAALWNALVVLPVADRLLPPTPSKPIKSLQNVATMAERWERQ
jgi:hypothetical protein